MFQLVDFYKEANHFYHVWWRGKNPTDFWKNCLFVLAKQPRTGIMYLIYATNIYQWTHSKPIFWPLAENFLANSSLRGAKNCSKRTICLEQLLEIHFLINSWFLGHEWWGYGKVCIQIIGHYLRSFLGQLQVDSMLIKKIACSSVVYIFLN